ncbi:MAG TPA: hypothetical protein DC046_07240 [Rhodospirillaceae bacterium]|nr:hypothetical protein [Rhodospirillaceae bacterium]
MGGTTGGPKDLPNSPTPIETTAAGTDNAEPGLPGRGGTDGFGGFGQSFLSEGVGHGQANRPGDVFHASGFLAANGLLPAPTRDADDGFLRGIENGQKRLNGLAGGGLQIDGIAKPWGPTEILSQRAVSSGKMKPPRPNSLPSIMVEKMKTRAASSPSKDPRRSGGPTGLLANEGEPPVPSIVSEGGAGQHIETDPAKIRPQAEEEIARMKANPGRRFPIRYEEARIWALKNDVPARFDITDTPHQTGDAPFRRQHSKGVEAVKKYDAVIHREAQRQDVDSNLIRAIMYVENADGSHYGLESMLTAMGAAKTLMPMNINPKTWEGMDGKSIQDFKDPEKNITAAVALIRRIRDRIENPTPSKIGSIWNFTGREKVSSLGARIGRAYKERLWEKK